MNEIISLLKQHRSIRRFKDQALEAGVLEQLLIAGQSASTSSFIQTTSVIRVTDPLMRAELVEISGGQKYVASASEFLVFCADMHRNQCAVKASAGETGDFSWTEQFLAASVDVALFSQNVVVAAESLGLGCCYIGGIRNAPEKVSALLSLPQLVYPVFGLCIGIPDQDPMLKPRLPLGIVMHENGYSLGAKEVSMLAQYDEHIKAYYIERSKGRIDHTWSEQMVSQSRSQTRPFMKEFLNQQGLLLK